MPALLLVLIVRAIEELCRRMRKARTAKTRPLCTDCTHAHVQYAVNGRRAIACTFAGTVRPVLIDVMYCTDYRDRNTPVRILSIGFVREIARAEPTGGVGICDACSLRFPIAATEAIKTVFAGGER